MKPAEKRGPKRQVGKSRPWRASITLSSEATPTEPATPEAAEPASAEAVGLAAAEAVDDEPESGPLRRCAVTRERDYRARMVRFVIGPDRTVVPDLVAKLPGRGIWLSARRDVLETARTRGAFARAAKGAVLVPVDLTGRVEAGLARRITELLGLARRAGQSVAGFQKGREWLQAGRVALVIQADDGSLEERARFLSGVADMPVASPLPAAALGAVFGRDQAVHVVVAHGRLAEALAIETVRLAGIAGRELAGTAGRKSAGGAGRSRAAGGAGRFEETGGAGALENRRASGQAGPLDDGTAVR